MDDDAAGTGPAAAARSDAGNDEGGIMQAIIAIILAFAAGTAFAQAPADYLKRVADNYRAAFSTYERNGVVTRAAVSGDLFFGPQFDAIDINRDGVITRQELDRFLANIPPSAA
jgi:hypothetical protein